MSNLKIEGPVFPIVTPFIKDDYGQFPVDIKALRKYVDYLLDNGAKNIMVASATSRFAQLTEEEIRLVNDVVVDQVGDRGLAIASTGIMGATSLHLETVRHAESIGAKVIAAEYPWRFQSIEALSNYYETIVNGTSEIQILIHVTPGRSELGGQFRYDVESLKRVCAIPRVIAMKEAAGDPEVSSQIWDHLKDDSSIIVAGRAMETYLKSFDKGAAGFFVGTGNIVPQFSMRMYELVKSGKIDEAKEITAKHETLFLDKAKKFGWHAALKAGLYEMGIMSLDERPPMQPIPKEQRKELREIMVKLGWM